MVESRADANATQHHGVGAHAQWLDGWRGIRDASAQIASCSLADGDATVRIERLLEVVDGDDPVLAFMAMQALHGAVVEGDTIASLRVVMRSIATINPSSRADGRLQLVRHIIKTARDNLDAGDADSEGEDDSVEEQQRGDVLTDQIFDCFELLEPVLVRVVNPVKDAQPDSVLEVREVLLTLASFAKLASTDRQVQQGDLMSAVCSSISRTAVDLLTSSGRWTDGIPTVLLCDLFDLLVDSRALFESAGQSWTGIVSSVLSPVHCITSRALGLLHDEINPDSACATSFSSTNNPYPFIQKWIELGSACAEAILRSGSLQGIDFDDTMTSVLMSKLPSRKQLLHVLSEQDETMITSLIHIQSVGSQARGPGISKSLPVKIQRYLESELSPDLMFAELLNVFRDDHLVLVDMLMSSETRLLEFLMQYLRLAEDSWPQPCQSWATVGRSESIMSVLIRLRLELNRLVSGGLFPYNVRPLIRRLERLEKLDQGSTESSRCRSVRLVDECSG